MLSLKGSCLAMAAPNTPRTPWNRLRRGWKEFAQGHPEDELVQPSRGTESGRAVLYWCVLALLMVPPIVGLAMDPRAQWIRASVLAAVAAGLFAASQLEVERRNRGSFVIPLATGLLLASGVCTTLWLSASDPTWNGLASLLLLLALAAVALHDDPRLCVATGLFSMIGYGWIAHGMAHAPLAEQTSASLLEGWSNTSILGHLGAIACATGFASASARRGWAFRLQRVRDPVTGLMTASALATFLRRETARSRAEERPLSLALIRLERFAELSERSGGEVATAILRCLAALLRDGCRTTDGLAHLGEGTFGVAFLDSADPRLQKRLEELRERVMALQVLPSGEEPRLRIDVRLALAHFPSEAATAPELLELTTRRLRGEVQGLGAPASTA